MDFKQIKLLYRHVISDTAVQEWEQLIWQVTYNEFLLRSQAYNTEHKFLLFSEMVAANGKANALHYKIGIQATPFINKLNNVIPHFIGTLHEPIRFEMAEVKLAEGIRRFTVDLIKLENYLKTLWLSAVLEACCS